MKAHEAAQMFPMISGEELRLLIEDIRANGLRHPIITLNGEILDGRNRYQACMIAEVEPRFEEFPGDDPISYVIAANIRRRHLDVSARASIAAMIMPRLKEEVQQRESARKRGLGPNGPSPLSSNSGDLVHPETDIHEGNASEIAGEAFGVSPMSVKRAAKVLRDADESVVKAMKSGKLKVSDAAKIVDKPKEKQREAVEMVEAGEASTAAEAMAELEGEVPEVPPDDDQGADLAAEYDAMERVIMADDRLAAAFAETKRAVGEKKDLTEIYERKCDEANQLIRDVKRWMRKAQKSAACEACKAALGER